MIRPEVVGLLLETLIFPPHFGRGQVKPIRSLVRGICSAPERWSVRLRRLRMRHGQSANMNSIRPLIRMQVAR